MGEVKDTLDQFVIFLGSLRLEPELFKIKTFEEDLYGSLNPTHLLDKLFFQDQAWTTFTEFYDQYVALFGDQICQQFGYADLAAIGDGLRARLYRTQFGFLTEYHAYHLAATIFGSEHVRRGTDLDRAGVDFRIRFHGQIFNIHIFVDTPRSWSYRRIKSEKKGVDNFPGIHVNLPYALSSGAFHSLDFLPNGFGIYTKSYFEYLKKEIIANRIANNNICGTRKDGFIYTTRYL